MKKTAVFSALFLAAFIATAGITGLSGTTSAGMLCPSPICELSCSTETGPLCTNPAWPHYLYAINCECPHVGVRHELPFNPVFEGCCNKDL